MKNLISYLPKLYPGELIYSLFARYHVHSLNTSNKRTMIELFGSNNQLAVFDLPTNLNSFCNRAEHFAGFSTESIILNHTFYNYYTNFINLEDRKLIIDAMISNVIKGVIHMKSGVMASGINCKKRFNYCPKCVSEDLYNFGETYWRLTHQLFGVLVCPMHKVSIWETNISIKGINKQEFVIATPHNCPINTKYEIKWSDEYRHMLNISKECEFLSINQLGINTFDLLNVYKFLLHQKGLIKGNGIVDQYLLEREFKRYYGKSLLRQLHSEVNYNNPSCWLKNITRKHRVAFHPIRHILLINFLGETVESISKMNIKKVSPFGLGPYPCLNRASDHYGQAVIDSVGITICRKTKEHIGNFKCKCGFHYTLGETDTENQGISNFRVRQFGDVWIERVKELIFKEGYSYRHVARILGADTNTVIKYSKTLIKTEKSLMNDSQNKIKKSDWKKLIEKNKGYTITRLRNLDPALYAWLYRNEKEWLFKVTPCSEMKRLINKRVDWALRDEELSIELETVIELLFKSAPPVRITLSRVGSHVNKLGLLEKHLDKLPICRAILESHIESIEKFQMRRIEYHIKNLTEKNEIISEWKVRRRAGLRQKVTPVVEAFIKNKLNT